VRSTTIASKWAALEAAADARGKQARNLARGARAGNALRVEAEWIKDRLVEVSSTEYGRDLAETEQLLKAHAALAVAMALHEEPINRAVQDARNSQQVRPGELRLTIAVGGVAHPNHA